MMDAFVQLKEQMNARSLIEKRSAPRKGWLSGDEKVP
jgi:hypothetical protein